MIEILPSQISNQALHNLHSQFVSRRCGNGLGAGEASYIRHGDVLHLYSRHGLSTQMES